MIRIILDDNQAESLQSGRDRIELCDRSGKLLGYAACTPNANDIGEAERRLASDGPWLSTQQVLDHLDSLEKE
jgi:hypothetical protein